MSRYKSRAKRAGEQAGIWTDIAAKLRDAETVEEAKKAIAEFDASEFESLKEEMESWRDNMEEKLSQTPKYEEVSEACDALDSIDLSDLEGREYEEGEKPGEGEDPEWKTQVEEDADALESAASELESVNFPGMY